MRSAYSVIDIRPALVAIVLPLAAGCQADKAPSGSEAVLTTQSQKLSVADVQRLLQQEPSFVRERFDSSSEERKKYVERLTRTAILYEVARTQGMDQDPLLRRRIMELVAGKLVDKVRKDLAGRVVTDAEVEELCRTKKNLCEEPGMVRVSQIVLGSRADAEALWREHLGRPVSVERFKQLVASHSIDGFTKTRGGDLGPMLEGTHVGDDLSRIALTLAKDGAVSPPMELRGRWIILQRTAGRARARRPRQQLESLLRHTTTDVRVEKALEQLVDRHRHDGTVEVFDAVVEQMRAPESTKGTER